MNLAYGLVCNKRGREAVSLLQESLAILEDKFGTRHGKTIDTRKIYFKALLQDDDVHRACIHQEMVQLALENKHGKYNMNTLRALRWQVKLLYLAGEMESSIFLGRKCVKRMHRVLGDDHSETLLAICYLARALQTEEATTSEATALARTCVSLYRYKFDEGEPQGVLKYYAKVYAKAFALGQVLAAGQAKDLLPLEECKKVLEEAEEKARVIWDQTPIV